jgi:hypothetical protein
MPVNKNFKNKKKISNFSSNFSNQDFDNFYKFFFYYYILIINIDASTLILIMVFPIVYNVITNVAIANQQSPIVLLVMLDQIELHGV